MKLEILFFSFAVLISAQTHHGICQSTTNVMAETSATCPIVTVVCSADNVPSRNIIWHFDDAEFAIYTLRTSENFPITVTPENGTFNDLVGGVHIQILSASANKDNRAIASFLSTMTANFSALQKAQISEIRCGTFVLRSTLEVIYNPNNVPSMPTNVSVQPEYDMNSDLREVHVNWSEVLSGDDYCVYSVNYIVTIEESGSSNELAHKSVFGSDVCKNSFCSTSLSAFSQMISLYRLLNIYRVSVMAVNSLGSSEPAYSDRMIYTSIKLLFSHLLSFDNCIATARCMSILNGTGNCAIQYSQSSTDLELGPSVTSPLDTSFQLAHMESFTLYYLRITFSVDVESVTLSTSYMTPQNYGIIFTDFAFVATSLITHLIAFMMIAAISFIHTEKKKLNSRLVRTYFGVSFILALTSLILWVVIMIVISVQADNCSQNFRNNRIFLLAIAFFLSIACIASIVILALEKITKKFVCKNKAKQNEVHKAACSENKIKMKNNAVYGIENTKCQENEVKTPNEYDYIN